jgi:hypothetical protein
MGSCFSFLKDNYNFHVGNGILGKKTESGEASQEQVKASPVILTQPLLPVSQLGFINCHGWLSLGMPPLPFLGPKVDAVTFSN